MKLTQELTGRSAQGALQHKLRAQPYFSFSRQGDFFSCQQFEDG
jgi:hypothetical protein